MTRYVFGVMSNKWELESDDMVSAYIAMSLFIEQNVPIAVYEPQAYAFMPKDILDNNQDSFSPEKVRECLKTIKEVSIAAQEGKQ